MAANTPESFKAYILSVLQGKVGTDVLVDTGDASFAWVDVPNNQIWRITIEVGVFAGH